MTVAAECKYQVKKAVGRAGQEGPMQKKRQSVCLYKRLQWMQTGGAVCSQQSCRKGLTLPGVGGICLEEKIVVKD